MDRRGRLDHRDLAEIKVLKVQLGKLENLDHKALAEIKALLVCKVHEARMETQELSDRKVLLAPLALREWDSTLPLRTQAFPP